MPTYNDAWLAARKPGKDFTVDVMKSPEEQARILKELYGMGDDPVAGAKDFLSRPSAVTAPTAEDEAETIRRTTAAPVRSFFKDFTDTVKMGGSLGLEAIEKSPRDVNPLVRGAASFAKYASPLYAVPAALSGLRQLIAPERSGSVIVPDEESRLGGAMELGGAALSAGSMVAPRTGANMARFAAEEEAAKGIVPEVVNTARGYQAGGASAKQAGQRAGWPLGKSAEMPYQATRGSAAPYVPRTPMQKFSASDIVGKDRSTGQFSEGEGGLRGIMSLLGERGPGPRASGPSPQAQALDILQGQAPSAAARADYPQVAADKIVARAAKSVPSPADVMGENLATQGRPWTDLTPELQPAALSRFPIERLPRGGSTKARAKIVRERTARKRKTQP